MMKRNSLGFRKTWVWNPISHLVRLSLPLSAIAVLMTLPPLWAKTKGSQPQLQPHFDHKPAPTQDWEDPAYWGLKKGEYIPGPGCIVWWHKHKKGAVEFCAEIKYESVKEEGEKCD